MEEFKRTLFTEWTLRRTIGGIIGLFVAIQAILLKDALLGVLSAYFLYQIITNTGCFGAAACSIPLNTTETKQRIRFNDDGNQK